MNALEPGGVRQRVLRTVNQDGLPDAFMGFAMLVAAVYIYLDRFHGVEFTGMGAILPVLVIFGLRGLRKRFTYPRIGYADPRTRGVKLGVMILLLVLTLAGVGVFLLAELTSLRITPAVVRLFPFALGIGVAAWALVMGIRTRFNRFYPYAGLMAVALAVCYGLGLQTSLVFIIPMGLGGALMLVTGIAVFGRFIRTHPRVGQEATDGA